MLTVIRNLLDKCVKDIDSGNSNLTYEEECQVLRLLSSINDKDQVMSKMTASEYLDISRATFDNYVRDGFIPKGIKTPGFKELHWYKSDLDVYISKFRKD